MTLHDPQVLELHVQQALGAVTKKGKAHPPLPRPTSYRSRTRAREMAIASDDGQARDLPPDRPTRLMYIRSRPKTLEVSQPALVPFVGRCARAEFAHAHAWLK